MGPHPAQSWWQQRTSQLLTPAASPWGQGEEGQIAAENLQSPEPSLHSVLPSSSLFGGLGQLDLDLPSFRARLREAGGPISRVSQRLGLDIHPAGSVPTLQIIGSCWTYQFVIKLLPGPAEEIAADWQSSA